MSKLDCLIVGFIAGACSVLLRWGFKEAFTSHQCCTPLPKEPHV